MAHVARTVSRRAASLIAGLALLLAAGVAEAQEKPVYLRLIGIQSATVAPHGMGFAALSLTNQRAPGDDSNDGSAVVGFGLGNAEDRVGWQFTAHITSLTNEFGDSGYLSVKASKRLVAGESPVYGSLMFGQLANWGDANPRGETVAAAVTRFSWLNRGDPDRAMPMMMTFGVGNDLRNNNRDAGVFAGIGVGLTENLAASLAWTGESVTVGTGFRIEGLDNIGFALSVDDAFNQVDNRRLILSIGVTFDSLFGG